MEEEYLKVSPACVAQALAADYFCIYYVNTDNDKFIEYSASEEFKELGLPRTGDDFISFSRKRFEEIIYPEDQERFLDGFLKEKVMSELDAHGIYTLTFRLMFKNVPTYVHLKATRMIEKEGHHIVIGISSVDEQMKALEAFETAHHASITYSRIAQALAEDYFAIYYVDMSTGHFVEYSSDVTYQELGIEKSGDDFFRMSRESIRRVMFEEDQGAFLSVFTKENIQNVLDEHQTFTLSYRLLMGGIPTWVSMKATRMRDEDGNHIIIGVNNIDAQMQQQAEYNQAKEDRITFGRVATALAGDYFSIYVVDLDTDHFVEYFATEEFDRLGVEKVGEDFFNLSRRNMSRLIYEDDRERFMGTFYREKVMSILERDKIFTMKYRLMFGDTQVWVSMKATLLEDDDGRHLIIGTNNIEAQMEREQEYQQHVREARISVRNDFLANMSHDIRTPMNAIVGYTNIAKTHQDNPDTVSDALDKIGSSSHYLLSLINDVLDISKIESGKMQLSYAPCDLAALFRRIKDITALQAQNKSLIITYCYESVQHCMVNVDELRLEQIIVNIISNAIKYTPPGKTVDLIAEELPSPGGKNKYRFIIRDTGIGIKEDYLPHIFESFTREERTTVNRIQGTGLGLAITAKIVEMMGGTISVKSKLGEGSEFTVELELEPLETDSTANADNSESIDLAGHRILLVEDNAINAEIARMILEQYGAEVQQAENGKTGLEALQEKGPGYYDAVLMDIQMPVMNGFEATKAIRALGGAYATALPIIAMSANAYEEDVRDCLAAGMNGHIAKPFNPAELIRILHKFIKGH
ncbi:ATP-binding protein [uncultured Succiniclasticum sp.]|uniref:hybrid sensor histidine kinase/response regulator n=1 Tax=uncultured Succiniclasticum sp. TaxID=1500547 RepID=UPI0025F8DB66|nr:ATP-binding protein [uncultured Succiniclasticum sp.]